MTQPVHVRFWQQEAFIILPLAPRAPTLPCPNHPIFCPSVPQPECCALVSLLVKEAFRLGWTLPKAKIQTKRPSTPGGTPSSEGTSRWTTTNKVRNKRVVPDLLSCTECRKKKHARVCSLHSVWHQHHRYFVSLLAKLPQTIFRFSVATMFSWSQHKITFSVATVATCVLPVALGQQQGDSERS